MTQRETEFVRDVLSELSGLTPDEIAPDASLFGDLGLDSLDVADLAIEIEDEIFGRLVELDDAAWQDVKTVQDVYDAIDAARAKAVAEGRLDPPAEAGANDEP